MLIYLFLNDIDNGKNIWKYFYLCRFLSYMNKFLLNILVVIFIFILNYASLNFWLICDFNYFKYLKSVYYEEYICMFCF